MSLISMTLIRVTSMTTDKYERLVQVWKITEMRDGCVFATEEVEVKWAPEDEVAPEGFIYGTPGNDHPQPWFRKVKD